MTTLITTQPHLRVPHHPAHMEATPKPSLLTRLWRWMRGAVA